MNYNLEMNIDSEYLLSNIQELLDREDQVIRPNFTYGVRVIGSTSSGKTTLLCLLVEK